ncbi:MAG: TM2 domain-containing protein [Bacteroidia bacterium]|nr:TM2 domain-containing protein [Bacteroidia bacterium]
MDSQKVDMFIMTHSKFFDGYQITMIRQRLLTMEDSRFFLLETTNLKDPTTMLIISLIGGHLGIDRFIMGDVGLGVLKLLTCGGLGIWTIVDWFTVMGRTREMNLQRLLQVI